MSEGFGGIEKDVGFFPDGWMTAEVKPDGGDITNGDCGSTGISSLPGGGEIEKDNGF